MPWRTRKPRRDSWWPALLFACLFLGLVAAFLSCPWVGLLVGP